MTDAQKGPRFTRTIGPMILVALLGVASCEVERPPTVEATLTTVPADPPVVPVESPPTQTDPAANSVEAIEAEMQARRAERASDPGALPWASGRPTTPGTIQ